MGLSCCLPFFRKSKADATIPATNWVAPTEPPKKLKPVYLPPKYQPRHTPNQVANTILDYFLIRLSQEKKTYSCTKKWRKVYFTAPLY